MQAAFEHAFAWLGFGAKTSVGYGAMTQSTDISGAGESEVAPSKAETGLTPNEEIWDSVTLKWDAGGGGRITVSAPGGKTATLTGKDAEKFLSYLSEDQQQRLKNKKRELKSMRVVVEVLGNMIRLKRPA